MKTSTILPVLLILLSCNNKKNTKSVEQYIVKNGTIKTISTNKVESDTTKIDQSQGEVMSEDDIYFNGNLKRYFTLNEFYKAFGKPDSIKLMSEIEPCNYIFENEDGTKDSDDKYYYKDGSTFETSREKVAVDEFRFTKDNFILFKGIKLNSFTSISDLQKIFPNATKNLGTMDVYGEGKLQVIELREDENNVSDGHVKVFIKNGKLYLMHWWFPC